MTLTYQLKLPQGLQTPHDIYAAIGDEIGFTYPIDSTERDEAYAALDSAHHHSASYLRDMAASKLVGISDIRRDIFTLTAAALDALHAPAPQVFLCAANDALMPAAERHKHMAEQPQQIKTSPALPSTHRGFASGTAAVLA